MEGERPADEAGRTTPFLNYRSITTNSGGKGEAKEDWLRGFPALPNGIPSHDTFCRVFVRLDPQTFGACVADWMGAV